MDLSKYIKKSNAGHFDSQAKPKTCMECKKEIDRERAGHLYFQSFCCHECKERYVGHALEEE